MAPRAQRGDAELIRLAKRLWERCVAWESTARHNALIDTRFANGDAYNGYQWEKHVLSVRGDRPCLTHNKVRQHNLQIINDARQNKAQIKVTPTGQRATYEAAQVFSGIIRRIEYQSKAIDAYSTAIYHQVESGYGVVTVETEYVDERSFQQEIYIRRQGDPRKFYLDPDAKEYDKADMTFAFEFVDVPREEWEAEHGWTAPTPPAAFDNTTDSWHTVDHVRVAKFWQRQQNNDRLHLLRDGRTVRDSELDDELRPQIEQTREISEPEVLWYRIEGNEITERGTWPGKYIPIVPCIGEETVIDGVMDRKGHTRSQIDAQRVYNYWSSAAVEQVALQTKVPFVAASKAVEGHEKYWDTANVKNHAYLPYNAVDDDGNKLEPPQRTPPPDMAQAYIQGMTIARQDLLDVTGQYQAELGMPSNERSGVAIQQRQRQGDTATYHYIDNQAKMIRQVGRILLDLIPRIYDTTQVTQIMGEDGEPSSVLLTPNSLVSHMQVAPNAPMGPQGPQPLTPEQADAMRADPNQPDPRVIFNPNVGRYDVEADVGPSYGTQRQEAANAFSQIMAQNPAAFQVVGDFWAQNSDFPGADELAERLKRGLPPQYKPGPDPQVLQLQQVQQQTTQHAQQLLQQADAQVATLQAEVTRLKEQQQEKAGELAIKDYQAETDRLKAIGQIDPTAMQVIVRSLVRDMLQTELPGLLAHHGAMEMALQSNVQAAQPPEPTNGTGQQQPANGG
jgi:portal protein